MTASNCSRTTERSVSPADAGDSCDAFVYVYRDTDGVRLVRDGARDGLPDPPARVGGKSKSKPVFEFFGLLGKADVSLLNKVHQWHAAVCVFFDD
jgi:hypothetical protein